MSQASRGSRRVLRVSLACISALTLVGCAASSSSDGSPIAAPMVARAVESATGFTLSKNYLTSPGDSTRGLAMSYVGGGLRESVLVIVFEEPADTRAFLGSATGVPQGNSGRVSSIIRVENVVVVYSRQASALDRAAGIRARIRGARAAD